MKSQKILWFFPTLFAAEVIVGLNGYQFTFFGQSIRIILFILAALSLVCNSLLQIRTEGLSLCSKKDKSLWHYVQPMDWFVFGFLVLNGIWATAVPLIVRGDMNYSIQDFRTLLALTLYFPCVFLLRCNVFPLKLLKKLIYWCIVLLAFWHSIMFIGDSIMPGFYLSFFDLMDQISFGTAVRADVVLGFGVVRIIQTTSLFLIPGLFMAAGYAANKKWREAAFGIVILFAILITYTKSIWFGVLAGVLLSLVLALWIRRNTATRRRLLAFLGCVLLATVLINFALDNTIVSRATNGLVLNQNALNNRYEHLGSANESTGDPDNYGAGTADSTIQDLLGSFEANQLRSEQAKHLLNKWSSSPVVGYGYGAYAKEMIRRAETPYMYEYTLPALLMKLGVVGIAAWVAFIVALVVFAWKKLWKNDRLTFILWLATALSFAMAVQTNPFLFTFPGMFILLLLCIMIQIPKTESEE